MSTAVAPGLVNRVKTRLPDKYEDVGKSSEPLATFLGLFSIGLGLWELAAPRSVARVTGAHFHPQLIQAYGLRELMAGFGLLTERDAVPNWLWARVAGDALDLATLGAAYKGGPHPRPAAAGAGLGRGRRRRHRPGCHVRPGPHPSPRLRPQPRDP